MNGLKSTLVIDIWSDLVCPWCWIAKKRFEQALLLFEHKDDVVIRYHSFRISNDKPALPFSEALKKKFGNKLAADNMMNQVVAAGKMEGLTYNFDTMLFGDTEDALTLVAAARKVDLGEQLMELFSRQVLKKVVQFSTTTNLFHCQKRWVFHEKLRERHSQTMHSERVSLMMNLLRVRLVEVVFRSLFLTVNMQLAAHSLQSIF